MKIETARLLLEPVSYELLTAAAKQDKEEIARLGYRSDGEWPGKDFLEAIPYFQAEWHRKKGTRGFDSWIFADKNTKDILGGIGFTGDADDAGWIEIGFATNPSKQRCGYCREAAKGLMDWAFSQPEIAGIRACSEINNKASAGLLRTLGFSQEGQQEDLFLWKMTKSDFFVAKDLADIV